MGPLDQPPPLGATMNTDKAGAWAATVCLHELLGRVVVDAAGHRVGRVVDAVADPWGDELRVTALLVGPSAWRARFGPQPRDGGRWVRWEDIAALAPHVVLQAARSEEG
jgi:sporulation protein YlmC with PRC-barrel domain